MMRWQRKQQSANESLNTTAKTPLKPSNLNSTTSKTPSKTPKTLKANKTPGKGSKTPKTPGNSGDRFIPSRNSAQLDLAHYKVVQAANEVTDVENDIMSPSKLEFKRAMNENLNGDTTNSRILSFKNEAPQPPEGVNNNMKVLYSQTKSVCSSTKKTSRPIPQVPERILDAPEILDDYYLNLLDWSCNNHVAVALGGNVYLWNAGNGEIMHLVGLENSEDYVSSVSWVSDGTHLAVGTSNADVQIWDLAAQKRIRNMSGHAARVGALSWNAYVLSSGSRSGNIHHHDVRVAQHHISTLAGHSQEVCGLKWSPDGRYLASGGNDNILNIWGAVGETEAEHQFTQHLAAVKAIAWCPWQPSILASGGGTADRHIRFWNCNTGIALNAVDTKSQVCSILWSREYKELVSSHGFAHNQLIIWKYPTMQKVTELTGHTSRVLHMSMSPDGSTVVSAAADETLRLWKCFAADAQKKQSKSTVSATKMNSALSMRRM